jgi:hypothetical protein
MNDQMTHHRGHSSSELYSKAGGIQKVPHVFKNRKANACICRERKDIRRTGTARGGEHLAWRWGRRGIYLCGETEVWVAMGRSSA